MSERIHHLSNPMLRFWNNIKFGEGCWQWTGYRNRHKAGYGMLNFFGKPTPAHRLSWAINVGRIPTGKYVLHSCDNPLCVRPSHLFIGDQLDNMRDMKDKGRGRTKPRPGELNPMAKLTKAQVLYIRKRYAAGDIYQHELAEEFGIAQSTVSYVVLGQHWK